MPPQVAVTLTTANDDRSSTVERTAYGFASAVLATMHTQVEVTINAEGELDIRVKRQQPGDRRRREIASVFMDPEQSGDQALRVRWHREFTAHEPESASGYEYVRLTNRSVLPPR
jgi:hypothetical protein